MEDTDIMPFGKYKGKRMIDVPASYLLWLWNENKTGKGDVFEYVKENLSVIKQQAKTEGNAFIDKWSDKYFTRGALRRKNHGHNLFNK